MRLPAVTLLLTTALLTGCSDAGGPTASPSATSPATSSPSASTGDDPFETITPPNSPGVGPFDPVLANRAYAATQGLLALQLLEKPSVLGDNTALLVDELSGASKDPAIVRDLGGPATRNGLDYRPLFPKGTTVGAPLAAVTGSTYIGEAVTGQAGELGLRIRWTGTLTYAVTFEGKAHRVVYTPTLTYIFSRVAEDQAGLVMQQTLRTAATVEGVITACLAKGLLYPGAPTAACPV